jgi:hypothetical protein
VILFTAERSQSFSIKQIHNPGHNLKCSAVKKSKGSAVNRYIIQGIISKVQQQQIISKVEQ